MKKPQPKISFPGGVPVGFQIGFNDQIYTCTGEREHVTLDNRIVILTDWAADCAKCGKPGTMTSKRHDAKPSCHCAPCRALNRTSFK